MNERKAIYDFAGWLTSRPTTMYVGAPYEAAHMVEAIDEYFEKFPDRINRHSGQAQMVSQLDTSFKDQVIEHLVMACIYQKDHETMPRKAIQDLIAWEVKVALDPQVSSDAAALIERGRRESAHKIVELQRLLRMARAEVEWWTPDESCEMSPAEEVALERWFVLRDMIDTVAPSRP